MMKKERDILSITQDGKNYAARITNLRKANEISSNNLYDIRGETFSNPFV